MGAYVEFLISFKNWRQYSSEKRDTEADGQGSNLHSTSESLYSHESVSLGLEPDSATLPPENHEVGT